MTGSKGFDNIFVFLAILSKDHVHIVISRALGVGLLKQLLYPQEQLFKGNCRLPVIQQRQAYIA